MLPELLHLFRRRRGGSLRKILGTSTLFDPVYYLEKYPELKNSVLSPLDHFLEQGARENRNPNAFFDSAYYRQQAGLKEEDPINPLLHYLEKGAALGIPTSPLFDTAYYLSRHAKARKSRLNPLEHYLLKGRRWGYRGIPHPAEGRSILDAHQTQLRKCQVVLENFLGWGHRLDLPPAEHPEISIIIVLHNRAELTLHCLLSLARMKDLSYEVVLVDNASTDRSQDLLAAVGPAQLIRNQENIGFLAAANQGAEAASGKTLLFLNNDTELLLGSVAAALAALQSAPEIGAVGGRVLNLNGSLQEAGSMLWKDGHTDCYGRGENPDAPEYMFRRRVDYCSGCFLMTPADLFRKMGSFDGALGFGYYEEVDYCLRLQEAGYATVYEPRAVLFHHEHGSGSREKAEEHARQNRLIIQRKHAAFLDLLPERDLELQESRRFCPGLRKILVVGDPISSEAKENRPDRSLALIQALVREGIQVTFYPMVSQEMKWTEIYSCLPETVEYIREGNSDRFATFLAKRVRAFDEILVCPPSYAALVQAVHRELAEPKPRLIEDPEAFIAVTLAKPRE